MKGPLIHLASIILLGLGCSQSAERGAPAEYEMSAPAEMTENYDKASNGGEAQLTRQDQQPLSGEPATQTPRQIIRTAQLRLEVKDCKQTRQDINPILAGYGAFVNDEHAENLSYQINNTLVIRVDPAKLDSLIADLEPMALLVAEKNISAQDVTAEYVDIQTRLATKRKAIQRYEEILQQAKKVEEILEVEDRLRIVIEEIESMEGRLRVLTNQVRYSTLTLVLYQPIERPQADRRGFGNRLLRSLSYGWTGFQEFLLGVAALWPFWLIIAAGVFLFRKWWRKRKG